METFHIITPCSRPHSLQTLKENILNTDKNRPVIWHICFDSTATRESERVAAKRMLYEDWIRIYEAASFKSNPGKSQINFVLTHFYLNLFEGFIGVLDDDNLLPPDFFCYNYDKRECLIYLLPQFVTSSELRIPKPEVCHIDQAQIIVHSDILHFYQLDYQADGLLAEKICKSHNYKILEKPVVYYNKLRETDHYDEVKSFAIRPHPKYWACQE